MPFIIVLLCTVVFCFIFKDLIHKCAPVFYGLAVVLSALYAVMAYLPLPFWLQQALFTLMQKGTLATALFVVVMYIGVFKGIKLIRDRFIPIRATLSIMACILILGHVVKYTTSYILVLGNLSTNVIAGLVVSLVLFILMMVLGITSFKFVRRRMTLSGWHKLQRWAYAFYALIYVHVLFMLLPSALNATSSTSREAIIAYTVVFGLYAVLRIGKAVLDKRNSKEEKLSSEHTE